MAPANRQWMPLYVADYKADTGHLCTLEHGSYLLLIMHYWQTGGLPNDDVQLARIACLTRTQWKRSKPVIAAFFGPNWTHKRIDSELAKSADISSKRRASAEIRHSKSNANAKQLETQSQLQSQKERKKDGASAPLDDPKADLFRRGREVLGVKSGALIAKLLRSFGQEDDPKVIAKARARIEEASTKANPTEWVARVMNGAAKTIPWEERPWQDFLT